MNVCSWTLARTPHWVVWVGSQGEAWPLAWKTYTRLVRPMYMYTHFLRWVAQAPPATLEEMVKTFHALEKVFLS